MELLHAASDGKLDEVKFQIEMNGYDVNFADNKGRTALHMAVCKNHQHVVEYLMQAGADSSKRDVNNNTALHLAALGGHSKVSALILANSRPETVMAEDMHGHTPLYLAHLRLKKVQESFRNHMTLSDVQDELQYIIDIISTFVEKHGNVESREKLLRLKTNIARIHLQDKEAMDEVDLLLQSLTL